VQDVVSSKKLSIHIYDQLDNPKQKSGTEISRLLTVEWKYDLNFRDNSHSVNSRHDRKCSENPKHFLRRISNHRVIFRWYILIVAYKSKIKPHFSVQSNCTKNQKSSKHHRDLKGMITAMQIKSKIE
jgi:hypothetical protein